MFVTMKGNKQSNAREVLLTYCTIIVLNISHVPEDPTNQPKEEEEKKANKTTNEMNY